jgi:transcriptional regulator with XRE-family HTH domain
MEATCGLAWKTLPAAHVDRQHVAALGGWMLMATFGGELLALMAERGESLRGLSKAVSISDGYLSRLSRDERIPSSKIAEVLDTHLGADGRLIALAQAAQDSAARRVSGGSRGRPVLTTEASPQNPVHSLPYSTCSRSHGRSGGSTNPWIVVASCNWPPR